MSVIIVYSSEPISELWVYPWDWCGQDVMTILPATPATWQLVGDVLPRCRYVVYSDTGCALEVLDPILDTLRPGCYVVPDTPPDQPLPFPARLVGRVYVPEVDVTEEVYAVAHDWTTAYYLIPYCSEIIYLA